MMRQLLSLTVGNRHQTCLQAFTIYGSFPEMKRKLFQYKELNNGDFKVVVLYCRSRADCMQLKMIEDK